jgi:signal transduction histidine kinase
MTQPLDLDQIEARANALNALGIPGGTWTATPRDEKSVMPPELAHVVEDVLQTGGARLRSSVGVFGDPAHAEFVAHAREDVAAMAAEIRRLRARVAELEGPAVEARAALAALCYDLEDPGTAALGALYLISQATTGIDAPRDDTAEALAKHDADVIRKAAQVLEETDRDDDAVNLLYLLADGKLPTAEEAHVVADDTIWLERRPCGCIVAAVVAHVPDEWTLTTAEDAAMHFHPTEGERRRAAQAGLTVEPVASAQYREQYRDRWHCNRHAAAVSAAARP